MIDQLKNKISSSNLSGSSSNLKNADLKESKVKVPNVDQAKKTSTDTDNGKVSQFISKESI